MEIAIQPPPRRLKLIFLRVLALAGVVLAIPLVALIATLLAERKHLSAKYEPGSGVTLPLMRPSEPLQPIPQTEPHTCGLLAISAVFKAYGQDPETADLRFHLGTDRAAVLGRGPADSTGTLHPDMVRVLTQQGWDVDFAPDPRELNAASRQALEEHFENGPALALIALEPSNALHWIALQASESGQVRIIDSLESEVREQSLDEFLSERTLSILLLTPRAEARESSAASAHADGVLEMARVGVRLQVLNEITGD